MVTGRFSTLAEHAAKGGDWRLAVACAGLASLAACSTARMGETRIPPPPPPPPPALEPHTAPTPAPSAATPKGCADEKCVRKVSAMHRQYYDQRHKRYYYYDPARRAYFWEDGAPKS